MTTARAAAAARRAARRARAARRRAPAPRRPRSDGVFAGPYAVEDQRRAVMAVLEAVGFDPDGWRLDRRRTRSPRASRPATCASRRATTCTTSPWRSTRRAARVRPRPLRGAASPARLVRTPLGDAVSLGVHESQSRLWENVVGRGRPFCAWLRARSSRERCPGARGRRRRRALPRRQRGPAVSLIRVEADETTYNLHIVLRFELELALVEGSLAVDDLPAAWNEGMHRLLGIDVPDDGAGRAPGRPLGRRAVRLLPDLHAREPDRRPAVGRAARRRAGHRRADRARRLRALREWLRSRSTSTGASSRRPSCCAGRPARSSPWRRSCATCGRSSQDVGVARARADSNSVRRCGPQD